MLLKNEKEHEEYSVKIYEGIGYSDCSLKTKWHKIQAAKQPEFVSFA